MGGGLSVRQNMIGLMKLKEMSEIEKYRQQMNFPVESTSSITIGSGSSGQPTNEETTPSNKGNTYNRNSKRGTRLVRSR